MFRRAKLPQSRRLGPFADGVFLPVEKDLEEDALAGLAGKRT
jgi:hypothetical protein